MDKEQRPSVFKRHHFPSIDDTKDFAPANFETAVSETKFGKFNILLILMILPASWANGFETTAMSYVFPAAQCDLNLTLDMKGSLNSISFVGMIFSAVVWGFVADTLGRKKLIVIGYFAAGMCVLLSGFSQNYTMLMVLKFLSGLICNGPGMTITAYISEFHCLKYRSRVQLFSGFAFISGVTILPLLALAILPMQIEIHLFNGFVLHAWNILIILCAIPGILASILFLFMPESPKFLMAVGKNDRALSIFRRIYRINTGDSEENYKIKVLIDEIKVNLSRKSVGHITANRSRMTAIKEGFLQMKPLVLKPLRGPFIVVLLHATVLTMGYNTIRLWMPQLFTAIHNYEVHVGMPSESLCDVLAFVQPNITETNGTLTCTVDTKDSWTYLNSAIIGGVMTSGYFFSGLLITRVEKKKLLYAFTFLGSLCGLGFYFSSTTAVTVALSSIYLTFTNTSAHLSTMVVVDFFSTTLRVMTVSLSLMAARIGSLIGNMIFPILLAMGCLEPFLMIGLCTLACTFLTYFLPNTYLIPLQ